ncbi:hypothetical protein [Thauera linaloolentis]|uniref:Transmembrane protein n=1 Tax=Thauera linaloolentis (strain DSM 12138 / JCM 21573 / CCUG 41526 / CIP 105981 / IAM 15112 / NBRC 102519 / 47Lol) TaxID=1123367 RepID=N6Z511_THAL4|nr:hypothetical protein [Thauera linaloolentis]ENO89508.1 hypothetical protein C666_05630 [Thauera linaloolentis 47Lol = DSM 12138]MCM8565403.1 hypothetical protein [Thauera linaloolentis]
MARPAVWHVLAVGAMLLGALWLPLPLYLAALAVFGLPHVVWEMGFLRSRYAGRWPWAWWLALWAVLLAQAVVRGAVWVDTYSATLGQIVDLLSLLALGLIVAAAPAGAGWRVRLAGLAAALAVWLLLERGDVLHALLVLAVLHNFTPLAMVWDMRREQPRSPAVRALAWAVSGLFLLPLLVAFSGWSGAFLPPALGMQMPLLEAQWPPQWGGVQHSAVLSAIVLAQCLHYYCVIVLLPRAEQRRSGQPVLPRGLQLATWAAAALMTAYYAADHASARQLYAVAAGIHAWLEWPVLLMAWLSRPPALKRRQKR